MFLDFREVYSKLNVINKQWKNALHVVSSKENKYQKKMEKSSMARRLSVVEISNVNDNDNEFFELETRKNLVASSLQISIAELVKLSILFRMPYVTHMHIDCSDNHDSL